MRPTLALLALSSTALFGCTGDRCCRPCGPPPPTGCRPLTPAPPAPPRAEATSAPAPAPVRPAYPIEAEVPRLVVYDVSDLVGADAAAREALLAGVRTVVPAIASLEMKSGALVARGTSGEHRAIAAWLAAKRAAAAAPR